MTVKSGTHAIGPENGKLIVKTYVGGMGSKMGHDLVLEATRWKGTINVDVDKPSASSVQVSVDPNSLEVLQATGGIKGLSDKDRDEIAQNRSKTLQTQKFPEITFQSTAVSGTPPGLTVKGNLTVAGTTQPMAFEVNVDDGGGDVRFSSVSTVV